MIVSFFGLSVVFFMFSWNAYNDITDIETDRVNRPDRPLPSGKNQQWFRNDWIDHRHGSLHNVPVSRLLEAGL